MKVLYILTKPLNHSPKAEWPTLCVAAFCYSGLISATTLIPAHGPMVAAVVLTLSLTLYSSLCHEVLHGHPFRARWKNTLLVFPALGLFIPYPRFRDTHLAHHNDPALTDPYDDPETNFVDPVVWSGWSMSRRALYRFNNTLLGRMLIGPVISTLTFWKQDLAAMRRGDRSVQTAYLFHIAALLPVALWCRYVSVMPFWQFCLCAWASLSVLKIRTFLEHRAHERARCRSVIIEDRGLLSFLFLNNNLHAVHHAAPGMAWYDLRRYYLSRRDAFLERNGGYAYRSYGQVICLYLLSSKDPVPHSLWASDNRQASDAAQGEWRQST